MSAFRNLLRAFAANRRGNVAMIYGLALVPLALAAGTAIDFARAIIVRSSMAEALDAAGLAVGGSQAMSQADMEALAQFYFNANYKQSSSYGTPTKVSLVQSGQDFTLSSTVNVPTTFLHLVSLVGVAPIDTLPVSSTVTITRNSINLEVALALDTTGSMAGTRIADLKTAAADLIDLVVQDTQSPTYSKVALIPYSMAVNVGSYADQARGAIVGSTAVTNATWASGTAKTITKATKTNPVVITAANHGFANGDRVVIKNVSGMTQINYVGGSTNNYYIVAGATTTTFQLKDKNGNNVDGSFFGSYSSSSSGTATKCQVATCEVQVTSTAHGLANGELVYITGVGGMTQINNTISSPYPICTGVNQPCTVWTVSNATSNTFVLSNSNPTFSAYTSGGSSYCTKLGCQYYRFTNANNNILWWQPSTCVSERTTNAYTDAAPSTTPLGDVYPSVTNNPCITATVVPLSSDKVSLKAAITNLSASGSTAGHIGIAWAWYTLAQNFGYLWPGDSAAAAYDAENTIKFAVLMTDGAFNTPYCKGVISKDAGSGSGNTSDHINCAAPNGSSADQALQLCSGMKAKGITVYTVGFDIAGDTAAKDLLTSCATDSKHAYFPSTGSDLKNDFHDIAQQISNLRVKS